MKTRSLSALKTILAPTPGRQCLAYTGHSTNVYWRNEWINPVYFRVWVKSCLISFHVEFWHPLKESLYLGAWTTFGQKWTGRGPEGWTSDSETSSPEHVGEQEGSGEKSNVGVHPKRFSKGRNNIVPGGRTGFSRKWMLFKNQIAFHMARKHPMSSKKIALSCDLNYS